MTIIENAINTIKQLNDCVTAYSIFSLDFFNRPSDYIMKHFHPLILNLKRHRAKAINEFSLPKTKDLETEWTNYLINPNPSDAEIKRIIRLGLSVSGLEDELEFRNLIQRQEPQRILFKWLNSYVWRFQILNSEYNFKNDFWLELVENWISLLNSSKIKIPNLSEKHSLIFDFKDYKARKSHKEYYDKEAAEIFSLLENERIPEDKLLETVRDKISNKFYIDFFPSDPFLDDILARYFTYLLEKYLNDRSRLDLLRALLYNCTNPLTLKGCERFIKLFKSIEANINEREKNEIKNFTKNKLGDPRINKSEWQILKENDEKIYKKIRYWFNEQDFNLFFEFVFAGAVDPHGRKECWQRYLCYADDFRIFLPNQGKINEIKALGEEKNIDLLIKPILNYSSLTSFVLRIDEKLIFETVEQGNAAYVYDIKTLKQKTSLSETEKLVLKFFQYCFIENRTQPIAVSHYLSHTGLAPQGNQSSFIHRPHWRFIHDRYFKWHEFVSAMMMQLHGLYPKDPKTGEKINYA